MVYFLPAFCFAHRASAPPKSQPGPLPTSFACVAYSLSLRVFSSSSFPAQVRQWHL